MLQKIKKLTPLQKRRYVLLLLGILLLLPPLALLSQYAGEGNFCGSMCPRRWIPENFDFLKTGMFAFWAQRSTANALVLSIFAATIFFGRIWCSHLCPVGGVTELGSMAVPRKLRIDYRSLHAPAIRFGYFAVFVLAPLLSLGNLHCRFCDFRVIPFLFGSIFEPAYRVYFTTAIGALSLVTMAGLLGVLSRGGRAYCNFACPIGVVDSAVNYLGSKLSFAKRMRVDEAKCVSCGSCANECPTQAIRLSGPARIDQLSCFSCRECESACRSGAISYRRG